MEMNANLQNGAVSSGIGFINRHTLLQCNESSNLNYMNWAFKKCDVSNGHYYMNIHTVSEANNHNFGKYIRRIDDNTCNIYEMENTVLQDSVDINVILPASTLREYANNE